MSKKIHPLLKTRGTPGTHDIDLVKAYFNKDLYDITKIECSGNVKFNFVSGANGKGGNLNFSANNKIIEIMGKKSYINYNNLEKHIKSSDR